jgi:adenine-specific DNA-methyltransferase
MPTLEFKGKPFVYSHHLSVPFRELVIDPTKSLPGGKKAALDDNLIIYGDNLEALKALLPRCAGKVDVIYIDPPYNTGSEGWAYNDNVNSPLMKNWLGKVVDRDDLERRDKWLCMAWPRLTLLRELLSESGVIFISIDDNEMHDLRCLMDELFGDANWVGTIVWKNVTDNNPTNISVEHEYIVCYAKDKRRIAKEWKSPISAAKQVLIDIGAQLNSKFKDPDKLQTAYDEWFKENRSQLWPLDRYRYIDKGGVYTGSQSVHNPGREGYRYDVFHPKTKKPCKQPLMGYRFPPETMEKLLAEKRILFGEDETKIIELKVYAHDYEDKLPSVITLDGRIGAYELRDLFPDAKKIFETPKPSQLIEQLLSFVAGKNALVLDSFAGSGTTAHAVLRLNQTDEGNRRFILIETEPYADTLTAERVRRVINGVPKSKNEEIKNGLEGSFTYCNLGDPIELERFFSGEGTPSYEQVARYVVYTATGQSADTSADARKDWFVAEAGGYRIHLIYKPDLTFMRGNGAAVSLDVAKQIEKGAKGKPVLVFAAAKFMSQADLTRRGITFCQLPYSIHRVLGEAPDAP